MPVKSNKDIYDGTRILSSTYLSINDTAEDILMDKNNSLLILAPGDTTFGLSTPVYASDPDIVSMKYGADSILTECFNSAQELGAKCVFLANIQSRDDFLDFVEVFNQYDFAYVVPIGIYMSDTFNDYSNGGQRTTYYTKVMSQLKPDSETVFIATDKHASLYEDIDSFINDMNEIEQSFLLIKAAVNRENILFIANNLVDTEYANLYAAAAITSVSPNIYPEADFGDAIFDIDQFDMSGSWSYFKNHELMNTSIENLLNEYDTGYPQKIFTISRIIKIIKREIDLSEFCGRQYTDYQKLLIQQRLDQYLTALTDICIRAHSIDNVTAYNDYDHPGTVVVVARFTVVPINCIESIQIEKEVEIAI